MPKDDLKQPMVTRTFRLPVVLDGLIAEDASNENRSVNGQLIQLLMEAIDYREAGRFQHAWGLWAQQQQIAASRERPKP